MLIYRKEKLVNTNEEKQTMEEDGDENTEGNILR